MTLIKLVLVFAFFIPAGSIHAYELGDTTEDFTLPDLNGVEVSLHDHLGKIIVLNFFTTWCPGCNEEAERLQNDISMVYGEQGVTVIAVDIMEMPSLVQGWAAAQGVTYEILLAPDWTLFEEFPNALGLPYNTIIDPNMVIRYGATGFDLNEVTEMIQKVIDEGQVPVSQESWGKIKALYY